MARLTTGDVDYIFGFPLVERSLVFCSRTPLNGYMTEVPPASPGLFETCEPAVTVDRGEITPFFGSFDSEFFFFMVLEGDGKVEGE